MEIQLSVFNNFNDAKETWLSLENNSALYAFQKYYWLKNWFDAIGKYENLIPYIVILNNSKENIGILPLCIKKMGCIRCLTWMGGVITDYHAPILVRTSNIELDLGALINQLKKKLPNFDYIKFEKQPETIKEVKNPFVTDKCKPSKSNAYSAHLGPVWEEYYNEKVSSKTRYNNRRNMKLLSERGNVRLVIAENDDDRKVITQAMIQQKINRYKATNAKNIFKSNYYKNFYLNLAIKADNNNLNIHISALFLNEQIISTHWGMYDHECFYYLMPTYESNELSKYSCGKMLQLELMRWCVDKGLTVYDFTVGGEDYKHDWCDTELKLYRYTAAMNILGLPLKAIDCLADSIRSNQKLLPIAQTIKRQIRKIID